MISILPLGVAKRLTVARFDLPADLSRGSSFRVAWMKGMVNSMRSALILRAYRGRVAPKGPLSFGP